MSSAEKSPIINCHTHIFTGDHVPPFLSKSYLPWPFYYALPVNILVLFFRWWYRGPDRWKYAPAYKRMQRIKTFFGTILNHLEPLTTIAGYLLFIQAFVILSELLICRLHVPAPISC